MFKTKHFTTMFPNVASVDKFFDEFSGVFDEAKTALDGPFYNEVKTTFTKAPIDYQVTSDETGHKLEMVVPGLTKEDVSVKVCDGALCIKVEAGESIWAKSSDRKFTLPENADVEAIEANVENGILTVTVGIVEKSVKEIEIL